MMLCPHPIWCLATALALLLPADDARAAGPKLPQGWRVVSTGPVPADQTSAIGRKLGARITHLTNTVIDAGGRQLRVNTMVAATDDDAARLHEAILAAHGGLRDSTIRRGRTVVELVAPDATLVRRAAYALALRPRSVTYRITFRAAPVASGDAMQWNELFAAMLVWRKSPDEAALERVERIAAAFRWSGRLPLRRTGQGTRPSTFVLDPAPTSPPEREGDTLVFALANLPKEAGVPSVSITATIASEAYAPLPASPASAESALGSTPHFPVDDPKVKALAERVTAGATDAEAKVEALLQYLAPGRNLKYGGPVVGSRYGVRKVLDQGFGRCWDFADVFITLARASGVPARLVAGWLYGGEGHVWAEAYLPGKGWAQFDPTAADGCTADYIPYMVSESGDAPLVHLSMPEITIVSQSEGSGR